MKKERKSVKTPKKSVKRKKSNAIPTTVDGIKFRSTLESVAYTALKNSGLKFAYEPVTFTLKEKVDDFDNLS